MSGFSGVMHCCNEFGTLPKNATVSELAGAFLGHVKATKATTDPAHYRHCRTILSEFLLKLYGDDTSTDSFKPSCLKLVRDEMIRSRRFCRNTINVYTRRIVAMFVWGMENEWVHPNTVTALKAVKFIPEGYPDTFDNEEREPVSDDVIRRTLPFMPPALRAMVIVQRLTGCRPSEIFNMRVGDIDRTNGNGLWYYTPKSHKTKKHIGKKRIPLGKPEQELIASYLEDKKPEQAVFSPRTVMQERNAERRKNRKTKLTPSQIARDEVRATKPSQHSEFYSKHTYRQAIQNAVRKGNRQLPDGEKIPYWFPYQLRHAAGTEAEKALGLDKAQALLGHKTANITKRYAHGQLAITESMAQKRVNPFDDSSEGTCQK